MHTYLNQSKTTAEPAVNPGKTGAAPHRPYQFKDNRQAAGMQKDLQRAADGSKQVKQLQSTRAAMQPVQKKAQKDSMASGLEHYTRLDLADIKNHVAPAETVQRKIKDGKNALKPKDIGDLAKRIQAEYDTGGLDYHAIKNKLDEINKGADVTPQQAIASVVAALELKAKTAGGAKEKEKVDIAAEHKLASIQPYLALIPHLAGEHKGGVLTGGHLLKSMQNKWKKALVQADIEGNQDKVWSMKWSLSESAAEPKLSTMFPQGWSESDLRAQLLNSTATKGGLVLNASEITVEKKGDTFYPLQ